MSIMRIKDANGNWQEVASLVGPPGKDGTSVTVQSVTESTEDGGINVVEFSDGKTLNVRNGRGGSTSKYQQPDWGDEENGVILAATTLTVGEDGAAILTTPLNATIAEGEVYTIGFNGAEYQCTAVFSVEREAYILGNGALIGVETPDADTPFLLLVPSSYADAGLEGLYALFVPFDGTTSCTLSINGKATHKIPESYVDGYSVVYALVTNDGTGNYVFNKTFEELYAALKNGKMVYVYDNSMWVPMSSYHDNQITFAGFRLDGGYVFTTIYTLRNDGGAERFSTRVFQ